MSGQENAMDTPQFIVHADCTPVFEHRAKIERLFSVTLQLDEPTSDTGFISIGVKGDSRDRLNTKIYILSLVKCPMSVCTVEKKLYLPPELDTEFIESTECYTKAAIVPDKDTEHIHCIRGSSLSVNSAIIILERAISRVLAPTSGYVTPKNLKKSSRRLSCALQETLTKKNKKGNYQYASDAVKLAIASCEMEEVDEKPLEDDVILICDSDEEVEPIVITDDEDETLDDDSDDDVILIDTPQKVTQPIPDEDNDVFVNSKINDNSIEEMTQAFRNMETPSKIKLNPTEQRPKVKATVKPLNFDTLANAQTANTETDKNDLPEQEKLSNNENMETLEKKNLDNKKTKNKRTASNLDDSVEIETDDDETTIQRNGEDYVVIDSICIPKRQRIKSVANQPNKNETKMHENTKDQENENKGEINSDEKRLQAKVPAAQNDSAKTFVEAVKKAYTLDQLSKSKQDSVKNASSKNKDGKILFSLKKDEKEIKANKDKKSVSPIKKTTIDIYRCPKRVKVPYEPYIDRAAKLSKPNTGSIDKDRDSPDARYKATSGMRPARSVDNNLRYIVIDGSNVAMKHGQNKVFSCKGIDICVNYFLKRGHRDVTVFLPHWRKCRPSDPRTIIDKYILNDLEKDGYLIYTPSRKIGNQLVASYDDRYIIELAEREDGVVVSNDQYRDLLTEKHSWRRVIENRLLMYVFVRDHFLPPEDPYGKNGPTLDELLRKQDRWRNDTYSRLRSLDKVNRLIAISSNYHIVKLIHRVKSQVGSSNLFYIVQ